MTDPSPVRYASALALVESGLAVYLPPRHDSLSHINLQFPDEFVDFWEPVQQGTYDLQAVEVQAGQERQREGKTSGIRVPYVHIMVPADSADGVVRAPSARPTSSCGPRSLVASPG